MQSNLASRNFMLTVTTYTHSPDHNAHVSRSWFSSLPPLSMRPLWELCGQRAEAWVCSSGMHRLIAQSAPTPQLSSHWLLWHRVHLRASACVVAQIYAHSPSHLTSRHLHHQTVSLCGIQVPWALRHCQSWNHLHWYLVWMRRWERVKRQLGLACPLIP